MEGQRVSEREEPKRIASWHFMLGTSLALPPGPLYGP